ncbi:MAG TPA: Zn-dependent alcohol dehydrogenase [Ktedonobacterales bacterium]|jgi:Zn-dependent alcohol dehydrogenase
MPIQTRAAVLRNYDSPLSVQAITLDDPEPGEVVVRLAACGVCHSDLHMTSPVFKETLPAVLGHEGAGIVERVGPQVTSVAPGDHVVLTWIPSCGRCRYCATGRPALCNNRQGVERVTGAVRRRLHDAEGEGIHQLLDAGAFAEHVLVREEGVIPIADDIPLEVASLIGCGVLTGLGAVTRTARVEPGSVVVVIGAGGVGLNVIQGAVLVGAARIIAVDMRPAALAMARQFGATDTLDASDPANSNLGKVVRQMTGGGADYSFEVVGRPETVAQAWECLAPGGTAVAVGLTPQNATVPLRADFLSEKTLKGCIFGSSIPRVDVPRALSLYRSGRLKLDELVAQRYPLDAVNEALDALRTGTTGRGVLVLGE